MAILEKDCETRGEYVSAAQGKPNTCAIGALALAAGVSVHALLLNNETGIGDSAMNDIVKRLTRRFGLTEDDMVIIQVMNDAYARRADRRRKVCKFVNAIKTTK